MRKQWWQYFSYVGGAAFTIYMMSNKFSIMGFTFLGIAIISTVIYFFNQQKNSETSVRNNMSDEEIKEAVSKVEGLSGMTVNERLWVSGLMDEFDKAKKKDKDKAMRILELLKLISRRLKKSLIGVGCK
jgi:cellulose synthase/poly-beta-1,6-N-acetylglucosamine synthase-like glycosyltransferase